MADLIVTAASVVPGTGASILQGIAGATITAGQGLYLKSTDGRYYPAECDATAEAATCVGVALNGAAAGQTVGFAGIGSTITIGATTAKTATYMVSAAAGGICPQTDLVSTNRISIVGWATDTVGTFIIRPFLTGAVV